MLGVVQRIELAFGPTAVRLEPRARPASSRSNDLDSGPWDRERVRIEFRTTALSERETQSLRELPDAVWHDLHAGMVLLECRRVDLARLAQRESKVAILLHAHECATRPLVRPQLMGILNVTPDSFSDGGRFLDPSRALEQATRMEAEGADMIDIGGESTRPGSNPVALEEELDRVIPVIEALRSGGISTEISIDTRKAEVARRALDAGANLVNDTSAGRHDDRMLPLVAERECRFVAMHMRGTPRDMQNSPRYDDPVREILAWLRERSAVCLEAGISTSNLILDPGFGFSKRVRDNVALIRRMSELRSLGIPLLCGVSRKQFLGQLTGIATADKRVGATAAAVGLCVTGGAEILRVHDVEIAAQAIAVACAHSGLLPPILLAKEAE